MATTFGNTWWGNNWLQALTQIDYQNRIPRGASYARKGAVRDISVNEGRIAAKVQGTRPRPYSVSVAMPLFKKDSVNKLMDGIMEHPEIVSKLLKHELDPGILEIASKCGLKLFPKRWNDLTMNCSCPDWAVPCKHLAAVIYMMSREIDNNPFLVFALHGVDLMAELKSRGISEDFASNSYSVPDIKDILLVRNSSKGLEKKHPEFHKVDFSRLTDLGRVLPMLLKENPPFCPNTDFKTLFINQLNRIKTGTARFFAGKIGVDSLFPNDTPSPWKRLGQDTAFKLKCNHLLEWKLEVPFERGHSENDTAKTPSAQSPSADKLFSSGLSINEENAMLQEVTRINPDFIQDYSASTAALHQGFLATLHLMAKGNIAPKIVRLNDKNYAIMWQPCLIDHEVSVMLESLEGIIPDTMVGFFPGKVRKVPLRKAEALIGFFLYKLVPVFTARNADIFSEFFFKSFSEPFDTPGEKEIPGNINAWLSVYSLSRTQHTPVISVDEGRGGSFLLNFGVEDASGTGVIPLADIFNNSEYAVSKYSILKSFVDLSSAIPDISSHLSCKAIRPLKYTADAFVPILMQIIPAVKLLGVKVFLPKTLQSLVRPKPSLRLRKKSSASGYHLSGLFDFDWEIALGQDVVSAEEFRVLLSKARQLVKFKGKYIYISPEDIAKVERALSGAEKMTPGQLLQAAFLGEYESAPVTFSEEVREMIRSFTSDRQIEVPAGINAQLRPYQTRGYSWLYKNLRIGFGSILADDMGLGKTLQTITLIQKLKDDGNLENKKALIVAPTGLLSNWQAEVKRFAPGLNTFIYHGAGRALPKKLPDIILTTYGVLRSDAKAIAKKGWGVMVIDEAQNIKNPSTAQSKAVRSIPADTHIALSGTPVENRLSEFWSIMDYANSGYLGTLTSFNEKFAKPIQLCNDEECAGRFRKVTAPFMMRRMKTDKSIICDLPDKVEINEYATLTPAQAALYQKILESAMNEIEDKDTSDNTQLFERQGLILQMILALKQVCNHPYQYLKCGGCSIEDSGKAEMLLDRVEAILEAGEKVLIFTQFRETGDLLVKFIEERTGTAPMFLHGGCSVKKRAEMVERFQKNKEDKVFVLSLKAAGTGLNLTAASHVIHFDLWWNPAVEAQATDRAFRIGQNRNVMVHRFITKDSFEEKIDNLIQSKKHLAEMTVASGESWIGKLSNKELRDLFEDGGVKRGKENYDVSLFRPTHIARADL